MMRRTLYLTIVSAWLFMLVITVVFLANPGSLKLAHAATTITVNTLNDENNTDGDCSLREAMIAADTNTATDNCPAGTDPGPDVIQFSVNGTIVLIGVLPRANTAITIDGTGHTITLDATDNFRVFEVASTGSLTVDTITIQNGYRPTDGGGIYNGGGTLTITNSTLSGNNAADEGAAIYTYGTLTMTNSTLSGNNATNGGGIYNAGGIVTMTNSTLSGNNTAGSGGGVYNAGGAVTVTNATLSGNNATSGGGIYTFGTLTLAGNIFNQGTSGANCSNLGTLIDNGYNLSSDVTCVSGGAGSLVNVTTLYLGALSGGGAGQQVHTPQTGSAAIGVVPNGTSINNNGVTMACNGSTTDQLGSTRPINSGDACTSGSVEVEPLYDFGDAPDPTYPTLSASNGAQHMLSSVLFLGAGVDDEADGQPNPTATGDDTNGSDDEDGVVFASVLAAGLVVNVDVTASAGGVLNAWVDFNGDGDWGDAGEHIFSDQALVAGLNTLSISVPAGATPGTSYARFRFASVGGLSYTGLAADGEVEDYQVTVTLTPGVTIGGYPPNLTVGEDGTTDTYTLSLDSVPGAPVQITSTPGADCQIDGNGLGVPVTNTFTDTTPQTLTVSTVDNAIAEGNRTCTITHSITTADPLYAVIVVGNVVADVIDDDTLGINVTPVGPLGLSETGPGAQTFTFTLDSQPLDTVTIPVSVSSGECAITAGGPTISLDGTSWDIGYTVTVTAIDDAAADGDLPCNLVTGDPASAGDATYDALTAADSPDVSITILDNDILGISVVPTSGLITTESGGTDTFTISLTSQPAGGADVTVPLSSDTPTEGTVPVSVTIPNASWLTGVIVTVTGVDDLVSDGDVAYNIITGDPTSGDPLYDALVAADVADVSVTNQDNDSAIIADDDFYTTDEDQTLTVGAANGVLNGDSGGNGNPLSAVLDTNPSNGILNAFNPDGSFEYVPNPGFMGTDTFTYHATDGTNNSPSATVTIAVALVNGTTIAVDDGTDMPMNTSITLDVLANDIDPDGDPLHIADMTRPGNGQATIENGRIVYTPHTGFIGTDTFSYTAADDFGGIDDAVVTIIVWQPVPLCADFDGSTNEIIRADVPGGTVTNGSVFCRVLVESNVFVRQSAEVGKPEVLSRGVIQAVDVFALFHNGAPTAIFNNPISVCLQGSGAFLYLDATVAPRTVVELPVYVQSGYTCAAVPHAGTVVLVNGTASGVYPAPPVSVPTGPTTALTDCMVTTLDILNLRTEPGVNSTIIRRIPYDVTLTAFERTSGWFYVDYLGTRGWISAAYAAPQDACGQ